MTTIAAVTTMNDTDASREKLPLAGAIALIFILSWIGMAPAVIASWSGGKAVPGALAALQLLMILGPGLAAIISEGVNHGRAGIMRLLRSLLRWRTSPAIYLAAILGPAAVFLVSIGVSDTFAGTHLLSTLSASTLASFAAILVPYLILNTEELAWRGYVWPRMKKVFSPKIASLTLGVIWALFHAPLFLVRGGHPAGHSPLVLGVTIVALAVILSWLFDATGGSVLLCHIAHQCVNAWGEAIPFFPVKAHSLIPSITAAALLAIIAAFLLSRLRTREAR